MPTHLTRLVIRRILSNEPIVYRDCIYRRASAVLRPKLPTFHCNGYTRRRSFFGAASKPPRQLKKPDLAPGLEKMFELNRTIGEKARPPPAGELAEAFQKLVHAKLQAQEPLSDFEAGHAMNTFHFIFKEPRSDGLWISMDTLSSALVVLAYKPPTESKKHIELAEAVFNRIDAMQEDNPESIGASSFAQDIQNLVKTLTLNGPTLSAQEVLIKYMKKHGADGKSIDLSESWGVICEGFSMENDEAQLRNTEQLMKDLNVPISPYVLNQLVAFYANRGDIAQAKYWYEAIARNGEESRISTPAHRALINCCLRYDEREWGKSIMRSMLEKLERYYANPGPDPPTASKELWDVIFLWAAGTRKGVDEVDRMMNVMVRRTFKNGKSIGPDVNTINQLVEWCVLRNDSYFAERYFVLGLKWKIRPNATTYSLQVTYRLSGGDIYGARESLKRLQAEECSGNEDVIAANKVIRAMCASKKYDFNSIMLLADDLIERKARFEPETVSVLCALHLQRNELHDAIDLLQTHAFHFSEEQRLKIADSLTAIIHDREQSTSRAWDTYVILKSIFSEVSRETRTAIMNTFFARGRPDMAAQVFMHMRELVHPDVKATADTYIAVLIGIADTADEEHLGLVYNQMKLDLDIDPDTRIRNALILAYIACGQPFRAWGFWEDIVNSKEGPDYNSIMLAFRACERMPIGGEKKALELWARLRRMDIDISKNMFASYVGALTGNQLLEEAKTTLLRAEKEFGYKPDTFLLGTAFNAAFSVQKQEDLEKWMKVRYPIVWAELQKLGVRKMEEGPRQFNIDRKLRP